MKKINLLLATLIPLFTFSQSIFINEIHYDNAGGDVNEGIEIAGPQGADLSTYSLILYNGNGGTVYNTLSLFGNIPNLENGYGTLFFPISGIQNGSPDGVALVEGGNNVIQFLSYEGSFTGVGGPADGLLSADIVVSEPGDYALGLSLQLVGNGTSYEDFTWTADSTNTYNSVNLGQVFGSADPTVFINEIHYDNVSGDVNEGVEIVGTAGTDLSGWSIYLYNGSNGEVYSTTSLSGIIPDQDSGFGTLSFSIAGIQNGSPDGLVLTNPSDSVIQFLSYEGEFIAVGGPADGLTSIDIGISETGTTPENFSLQLIGSGQFYDDFSWIASASSFGSININQIFGNGNEPNPVTGTLFINEIHYDNDGGDINEGVEVAGTAGQDLNGWSLVLYNGTGGTAYNTINLSGILSDQEEGFGTTFISISGIQNGSPDGIALVAPGDSVIQFISYEGTFTAVDGPAVGLISEDIGQSETGTTPIGFSLQLEGVGQNYADFIWAAPQTNTFGFVNTNQSFGDSIIVVPPTSDTVTVAQARQLPINTNIVVRAVLTASDQFGGPSYLQDSTAGIALFDPIIYGDGLFNIGDELLIAASIGEFGNQIQLVSVDTVILLDTGLVVTPAIITLGQLPDFEGKLVTINNISFDSPSGILFPNTNYSISDTTATQELRIDGNTDLVGKNRPEGTTSVTGVVGRFQSTVQLLPRFTTDLPGATTFEPGGSEIPFDQTLDVATWNMEFFGTPISGFGPSDVALQFDNALTVISSLNADIIALQEVSNDSLLQVLVDSLPGYQLSCSDVFSRSFEAPDPNNPFPPQKLCFIYDTTVVDLVTDRAVFDEFYTQARLGLNPDLDTYPTSSGASSFWSSGRLPYQMIADVTIQGVTERINLINIHAKSGSGANDLARRVFDISVLKDTLDAQYANDKIILLGDYNDDVTSSIGGGSSTYEALLSDSSNYRAITTSLSQNNTPTFIGGSGSTIDHLTISNELFEDVIADSETIYFPFNDIINYEGTTSDHLPVLARFDIVPPVPPLELTLSEEQTVFFGYTPEASTLLEVTPTGGTGSYSFEWSTGETSSSIEVAPEDTTYFSVTVTDANGLKATDSVRVNVVDVTCQSWGRTKVQVCYLGRNLCVSEYLAHRLIQRGATLGMCNSVCEVAHFSNFRIYPNPFRDKVKLSLDCSAQAEIGLTVKSLSTGSVVYNNSVNIGTGTNELTIDLDHVTRGFYVLIITNNESGKVEKLITLFKR